MKGVEGIAGEEVGVEVESLGAVESSTLRGCCPEHFQGNSSRMQVEVWARPDHGEPVRVPIRRLVLPLQGRGEGRELTLWARLSILHVLLVLFTAIFSVPRIASDT